MMLSLSNLVASAVTLSGMISLTSAMPLESRACGKYLDAAKQAAANLQSKYFVGGAYPRDQQWVWISANDNFYLRQLDELTGEKTYSGVVDTLFNGWDDWLTNGGSYDDMLWVVISYLKSGNVEKAKHYYDLVAVAQDTGTCGGGIFWSKARDYKNAITNELYVAASGYLFDVTKDQKYMTNAQNTWNWLRDSKMRGANGLFNDGLKSSDCTNNGQTQWTYNQGTILVGLAYLAKNDPGATKAIDYAFGIMDGIMKDLTENNGLKESCDAAGCNSDQQTFKGIAMMYMAWFLQVSGKDSNGKYAKFIKDQGAKIMTNAVGPPGFYSNNWFAANHPNAKFTMQTQGSALGGLVAAAMQTC